MRFILWTAVVSAMLPAWCRAAGPLAVRMINAESIAQMEKRYPSASAEVDDPVYKRKQRYQGFWLRDLLKDLTLAGHAESDVYVRFRCRDGYLPIMPLARALHAQGLVAVRDLAAPPGKDWELAPGTGGQQSTPAPSYLVWVSPAGDTDDYPWPYQMVAIELVTSAEALGGLAPDTAQKSGYGLFVKHCFKCHAINGVGGVFGPELNFPCSVTEYWNPVLLIRFIASARSVRAGTRMPDFSDLSAGDIQAIVGYLKYMGSHKKSGAGCP